MNTNLEFARICEKKESFLEQYVVVLYAYFCPSQFFHANY